MSCHFPGSRVSAVIPVALENKHHHKKFPAHTPVPPTCFLLSLFCWADDLWYEISPLVCRGQLSWLCPLSRVCSPSAYWSGGVGETAQMLCWSLFVLTLWPRDSKELNNTVVVLYGVGSKWVEFCRERGYLVLQPLKVSAIQFLKWRAQTVQTSRFVEVFVHFPVTSLSIFYQHLFLWNMSIKCLWWGTFTTLKWLFNYFLNGW